MLGVKRRVACYARSRFGDAIADNVTGEDPRYSTA